MDLQDLTDVHTRRHTQRIQYDIQRTAIWQERHIFNRKDTGNHTLVTMTTGHLVTYRDLSLLCNVNSYGLIYTRCQLVTIFSCEDFCIYDNTIFTMRYFQGSITYFTCFFSEDCTQQTLICCQLCLALRCYFSFSAASSSGVCFLASVPRTIPRPAARTFCGMPVLRRALAAATALLFPAAASRASRAT